MRAFATTIAALLLMSAAPPLAAQRRIPTDLSATRGFNYQSAPTPNHTEHWLQYSEAETERDLDYARRLQLNQVRVFIPWAAWERDPEAFRRNLRHFVRAAHQRGIGVMPVLQYRRGMNMDSAQWPSARAYAADLVATIGQEPGLAIWDVLNEPDCCALPATPANRTRMAFARYMAKLFQELDPVTPVTIGATFAQGMIDMGEAVDVLSFHNYYGTRAAIAAEIATAKAYAASVGKALLNTEIGCVARANPYDVTLEEHMKAGVGWYIWELLITGQWGTVHGVFYPDGTVRDPSIVAALFGMFRNRGPDVVPEVPDREGHLTRAIENNRGWLADADPDWAKGLDLAEVTAHLLEASQLVALHDLPTRRIALLRTGQPDLPALRGLLENYTRLMEPYRRPAAAQ
jgi:hypothetical protein